MNETHVEKCRDTRQTTRVTLPFESQIFLSRPRCTNTFAQLLALGDGINVDRLVTVTYSMKHLARGLHTGYHTIRARFKGWRKLTGR